MLKITFIWYAQSRKIGKPNNLPVAKMCGANLKETFNDLTVYTDTHQVKM
jgi:hypothetical protein